jgi:hypothetical protein
VASIFGRLSEQRMGPRASPGAAGKPAPAQAARELKGDLGRDHGKDASGAVRERAREPKPRPK